MSNISEKVRKINCIFSETGGLYHKLNIALGLSDSISDILYQIYDNDGCYEVCKICSDLCMPKQTVSSAMKNLEKEGILYLETYSGKSKRAVLTEKGKQFCEDTVAQIFQIENLVFEEFSDSEIETFISLHEKYNTVISKSIDEYAGGKNGRE